MLGNCLDGIGGLFTSRGILLVGKLLLQGLNGSTRLVPRVSKSRV